MNANLSRLARSLSRDLVRAVGGELRRRARTSGRPDPGPRRRTGEGTGRGSRSRNVDRGGDLDASGEPYRWPEKGSATYAPVDNGLPDPGEVVWAWVPYEEDASRGKDRPVLVLDVAGDVVHALALTSKDHDRDAAQEARAGRYWMDIGTGPWDSKRRPSEVRLNRLLTLPADSVRREGAALDRAMFEQVIEAAAQYHR